MIDSAKYVTMATALSKLSNLLTISTADNCGVFLRADVSQVVKQALEQGTETVGMTYAVFKILQVILSMKGEEGSGGGRKSLAGGGQAQGLDHDGV